MPLNEPQRYGFPGRFRGRRELMFSMFVESVSRFALKAGIKIVNYTAITSVVLNYCCGTTFALSLVPN